MRQAVLALSLLLAGVLLAIASSPAPARSAAPRVECKLAGVHYLGTTRQGQKVCLTISADGKALRQYSFGGRFKCGDGTVQSGVTQVDAKSFLVSVDGLFQLGAGAGSSRTVTTIGRDGTFRHIPGSSAPSTFTGKIKGTSASGTLRQHFEYKPPSAAGVVCDTGLTAWSARRTG